MWLIFQSWGCHNWGKLMELCRNTFYCKDQHLSNTKISFYLLLKLTAPSVNWLTLEHRKAKNYSWCLQSRNIRGWGQRIRVYKAAACVYNMNFVYCWGAKWQTVVRVYFELVSTFLESPIKDFESETYNI